MTHFLFYFLFFFNFRQVSLFDVMKAKSWDAVVEALLSNTQQRTDEVVLIFERPLPDSDE